MARARGGSTLRSRLTETIREEAAPHSANGGYRIRDGQQVERQIGVEPCSDGADGKICKDLGKDISR